MIEDKWYIMLWILMEHITGIWRGILPRRRHNTYYDIPNLGGFC
jgi:hypothetical protein